MPPRPILFPYTTLFRSRNAGAEPSGKPAPPTSLLNSVRNSPAASINARGSTRQRHPNPLKSPLQITLRPFLPAAPHPPPLAGRSEEHTSELQSRGHLVCRRAPSSFPTRRSSDLGTLGRNHPGSRPRRHHF